MKRIEENRKTIENLMRKYNDFEYIRVTDQIYISLILDMSKSLAIIADNLIAEEEQT